jgi:hypothetical protein
LKASAEITPAPPGIAHITLGNVVRDLETLEAAADENGRKRRVEGECTRCRPTTDEEPLSVSHTRT